jgi:hypothetical protein
MPAAPCMIRHRGTEPFRLFPGTGPSGTAADTNQTDTEIAREQPVSYCGWRPCSRPVQVLFRHLFTPLFEAQRNAGRTSRKSAAAAGARDRTCFEHEHEHEQETVSRASGRITSGRRVARSGLLPATTGERDEAGWETRNSFLPGRPVRALFTPCSSACSSSC